MYKFHEGEKSTFSKFHEQKKSALNKFHEQNSARDKFHKQNQFHVVKTQSTSFKNRKINMQRVSRTENQHSTNSTNKNQQAISSMNTIFAT